MSTKDPENAPTANETRFYKCDECEHLHVALLNERGRFIAVAVISRHMLEDMLKCIDGELLPGMIVQ